VFQQKCNKRKRAHCTGRTCSRVGDGVRDSKRICGAATNTDPPQRCEHASCPCPALCLGAAGLKSPSLVSAPRRVLRGPTDPGDRTQEFFLLGKSFPSGGLPGGARRRRRAARPLAPRSPPPGTPHPPPPGRRRRLGPHTDLVQRLIYHSFGQPSPAHSGGEEGDSSSDAGSCQRMVEMPREAKMELHSEKWPHRKKPRCAESGDGCAAVKMSCL